ncbi:MAG TPA: hypothetical protein VGM37_17020 [Armatimonadota bacterium]|jgi:predicted RNA-binding Zn-ribbon protein involved in translation (DUF1610 family)
MDSRQAKRCQHPVQVVRLAGMATVSKRCVVCGDVTLLFCAECRTWHSPEHAARHSRCLEASPNG